MSEITEAQKTVVDTLLNKCIGKVDDEKVLSQPTAALVAETKDSVATQSDCTDEVIEGIVNILLKRKLITIARGAPHSDINKIQVILPGPPITNPLVSKAVREAKARRVPAKSLSIFFRLAQEESIKAFGGTVKTTAVKGKKLTVPAAVQKKPARPMGKPAAAAAAPISLNVHDTDGKWEVRLKEYIAKTKPICTFKEATDGVESRIVKSSLSQAEKDVLRANLARLVNGRAQNIDPANVTTAETIFRLMWDRAQHTSTVDTLIFEQLQDLSTGFCAQGRTTRFAQILNSLLDAEAEKIASAKSSGVSSSMAPSS